ncbi:MAG: hypothetical protein ACRDTD_30665, partial [Pseudonocardiaceae bacterium]
VDARVIDVQSVAACHALLSGAMNEAALWAASQDNPAEAVDKAWIVLRRMLAALRAPVNPPIDGRISRL